MSKNCIYAFYIPSPEPSQNECFEISMKSIQKYADKIGVDFIVKTERTHSVGRHLMAERLHAYDLLNEYDRVLCIGLDIIVSSDAPDIFEECPLWTSVYALNERHWYTQHQDAWTNYWSHIVEMKPEIKDKVDIINTSYFNCDVVLVSKQWQIMFEEQGDWFDGLLGDQDYFNYKIIKHGIGMAALPLKFNTITCHVDMTTCPENLQHGMKEAAWFLHYSSPAEKNKLVEEWKGKV
jgi:lipopolysaccharide biosynthesis glycosyltransferase